MMSEAKSEDQNGKERKPIQILRERRGGVPRELVESNKQTVKLRKAVAGALKDGPRTALEIAEATGIPSKDVFWHLMSMKKYGKVVEDEASGDYFKYALVAKK
jgi:hypothetical protein